ncbi:MAG: hypothetical protein RLY93_17940 [Sumerlaeia bacterium]
MGSERLEPETRRRSLDQTLAFCALNWILPGSGYLAAGIRTRGWTLFALLNGCFLLGLAFNGTTEMPGLLPSSENWNIVAVLTFMVKVCHGGGTMLLLWLADSESLLGRLLVRDPGTAYSDLGSFHLLVSGGLNYFATVRLYDILTGADEDELARGKEQERTDSEEEKAP